METCSIRSSFPGSGLWVTNSGTRDLLKKGSQGTPTSRRTRKGRESAEWAILRHPSLSLIQRGVLEHKLCLRACLSLRQGSWAFDSQTCQSLSSGQGEWWVGWERAWPGGYKVSGHWWLSIWAELALVLGHSTWPLTVEHLAGGWAHRTDKRDLRGHQQWHPRHYPPYSLLSPPGTCYGSFIMFCCKRKWIISLESPGVGVSLSKDSLPSSSG